VEGKMLFKYPFKGSLADFLLLVDLFTLNRLRENEDYQWRTNSNHQSAELWDRRQKVTTNFIIKCQPLPDGSTRLYFSCPDKKWEELKIWWDLLFREMVNDKRITADKGGNLWPEKPRKDEPLEKWFEYYAICKKLGVYYTLKELAEDTGKKPGYIRQLHSRYQDIHKEIDESYSDT
jgi:hypothetical protein